MRKISEGMSLFRKFLKTVLKYDHVGKPEIFENFGGFQQIVKGFCESFYFLMCHLINKGK